MSKVLYLRRVIGILLLIGTIGCSMDNSNGAVPKSTTGLDSTNVPQHLRDIENLTVLDPDTPPQFNILISPKSRYVTEVDERIWNIELGQNTLKINVDQDGRVYIVYPVRKNIQVYSNNGELLSTIGREGRGPGEFLNFMSIRMQGDHLMAYDMGLHRIQWFDLESHEPVRVMNLNPDLLSDSLRKSGISSVSSVLALGKNRLLIGGSIRPREERGYIGYFVMDEEGKVVSSLLFKTVTWKTHSFSGGGKSISSSDRGIVAVSPEGMIYHANTSEFLIHAINTKNETSKSIYYPYENAPLDREKVLEGYGDYLGPRMRDADFGDHWPALHKILADDENRLWVSTITEDSETHTWWVLTDSGELLAKFSWPRSKEIEIIRNGSIYASESTEEGFLNIRRYGFEMDSILNESVESPSIPIDQ